MSRDKNTGRRTAGAGDNGLGGAYAGSKLSYGDAAQPKEVCPVSRDRDLEQGRPVLARGAAGAGRGPLRSACEGSLKRGSDCCTQLGRGQGMRLGSAAKPVSPRGLFTLTVSNHSVTFLPPFHSQRPEPGGISRDLLRATRLVATHPCANTCEV